MDGSPNKRRGAENAKVCRETASAALPCVQLRRNPVSLCDSPRPLRLCVRLLPKIIAAWLLFTPALNAGAQSADDFFHGGAVNYLSNNIPKALEVVTNGRAIYPDDVKL